MGKGSRDRTKDHDKFSENFEKIFGKREANKRTQQCNRNKKEKKKWKE